MKIKICELCLENSADYVIDEIGKIENIQLNIGCHNQCSLINNGLLFAITEKIPIPITANTKEELVEKIKLLLN
ncbi:MAG: hypothetical protein ACK5HL_03375 [Bacilli bacterium]